MSLKNTFLTYLKNLPGRKTGRKIVVIYVDDYGSIRVKDHAAQERLAAAGVPVSTSRYSAFDTLSTTEDLQRLFEVLTSVKDSQGRHACFTPFANIANPDFEKIRANGFTQYFREPFTETLKRYGSAYDGAYELWKQGIVEQIFHPEYHGTEHINVIRFMENLRRGHKTTRLAFDNESVAVPLLPGDEPLRYATTVFYIKTPDENTALAEDIRVGTKLFEELLGYRSRQFTPGAGIYSPALHQTLKENGIQYINVQRYCPYPLGDGKFVKKFLYNGKANEVGQKYLVRNCPFETYFDNCHRNDYAVATCLSNIQAAFAMHAPAIVSTHRVNFAGALEATHRDDSLEQLKTLLTEILKRWPEVEFMSGTQMCDAVFAGS